MKEKVSEELINEWKRLLKGDNKLEPTDYFFEHILPEVIKIVESKEEHRILGKQTDTLICLLGFSPETIAISASILKPKRVVIIYSNKVKKHYNRIAKYLITNNIIDFDGLQQEVIDPTSPTESYDAIKRHWTPNSEIKVDVTGGKKVMSATAAQAAWDLDLQICYLESGGYDEGLRRPIPGQETLIVLSNPSNQKAVNQRKRAKSLYQRGLYFESKEVFEQSKKLNADNSIDEIGFGLSSLYYYWTNLDLNSLKTELDRFKHELESPRLKALTKENSNILGSIEAIESVVNGKPTAITGTMLELSSHYQSLGRYDFATLFAYRSMENIVRQKLEKLIGPKFTMSNIDYSLVENLETVTKRFLKYENSFKSKKAATSTILPDHLSFLSGLNLILAIDPKISQKIQSTATVKNILGRYMDAAKKRNSSILAHGNQTLTKTDCEKLIEDVFALGNGLLEDDFSEILEFKKLIKAPKL